VINGRVGSLLEVGTGFHPELTGRENVYLSGAILGMRREEIDRKFDEIVDFSGVEKFIDTPIKRYSSGMQVRLAFAVAAHLDPEILLIDEVLAVGDAEFQKKCLGKMGEVASEGRTVLFVSHNMEAVQRLCLQAMLLYQGRLEEFGADVQSVVKEYLYGRKKGFLPTEWKNLGNEFDNPWFKPLRFCVSNNQGDSQSMPLSNDTEMWVEIEAEIGRMDPALTIGYAIYSEDGKLLFWSYQTDQEKERWPTLRKGRIVLRGRIPSRLLNEGLYRVELIGGLHFREWLFKPGGNVPHIYLRISGGLSDSPLWMSKRPGVLAPVLEWVEVE
jgi:lipopolysaccharide transport system ATP-binding protein